MDVSSPANATMGPPARTSPDNEANGTGGVIDQGHMGSMAGPNAAAAAQAGAQAPKVVQTAFIHKLYKYVGMVLVSQSATGKANIKTACSKTQLYNI